MIKRALVTMMAISGLALTLNAGQIAIGSGTAGTNGLTAAYVNPALGVNGPTATSCSGASNSGSLTAGGWNGCAVAANTAPNFFSSSLYSPNLFASAVPSVAIPADTITAGGATFERVIDAANPTKNTWITNPSNSGTGQNIVISVGIYGVDKVWTLLNDYWGGINLNNTTVDFLFDDSSNGAGGTNTAKTASFQLINGQTIRSAVDYATGSASTASGTAIATTLSAATYNANAGHGTVAAGNAYTSAYTTGATAPYAGTTGNVSLDYQVFDFGGWYATDYLVSITIKSQLTSGQASSTNNTRAALSAIVVDQAPEPSTYVLILSGLGAVGYFRRRKA